MNFKIEELIFLNKYVQYIIKRNELYDWFYSFQECDKKLIVKGIWNLAIQAQIMESDIENATKSAGLKVTHTPVVMLTRGKEVFKNRGYKLSTLDGVILKQAFELVLECFALAERRRKLKEGTLSCDHWWHRDLSDELVIKDIIKNNSY